MQGIFALILLLTAWADIFRKEEGIGVTTVVGIFGLAIVAPWHMSKIAIRNVNNANTDSRFILK
jgi:hypothetical protein